MKLFVIIALAVWLGISLSRLSADDIGNAISTIFYVAWWILTSPFRLVRWIFLEAFGKKARERRQVAHVAWLAAKPERDAKTRARRKLWGYVFLGYLIVLVLYVGSLAMGRFAFVMPVVGVVGLVAFILWWNRRWKRLHGVNIIGETGEK
jgi:hypothetical protein